MMVSLLFAVALVGDSPARPVLPPRPPAVTARPAPARPALPIRRPGPTPLAVLCADRRQVALLNLKMCSYYLPGTPGYRPY